MYIEPSTDIRILKNVPINASYVHTLSFDNESTQRAYFIGCTKFLLSDYTYQRKDLNTMRVGIPCEQLFDCNYLMFRNTAFGSKWFYAFITAVKYINNSCCEITYEIDVLQTWLFDFSFMPCLVLREHTATDNIGDNFVDETIGTGEYVVNKSYFKDFSKQQVYIYATGFPSESGAITSGNLDIVNNVLSGLVIYQRQLDENNLEEIQRVLNSYVDNGMEDMVIVVQQMPSFLGTPSQSSVPTDSVQFAINADTLDGYKPRNNKLFTSPYNFVVVSNHSGSTATFNCELFADPKVANFTIKGVPVSTPVLNCYAMRYRGINEDYDSGLTLSNFPQVAWSGDSYKAWYAQNKANITASNQNMNLSLQGNAIGNLLGALGGASSGKLLGAITGVGSGVVNNEIAWQQHENTLQGNRDTAKAIPHSLHGKIECDSLNVAVNKVGFMFYQMCVTSDYAKMIDDYFTMYGYAVKEVKTPNIKTRPHWNYLQTSGCNVKGNIPSDDLQKIMAIHNSGVTYWHSPNEVGNYNLDNRP